MGGFGSTRWNAHVKRRTTEECLSFSVTHISRALSEASTSGATYQHYLSWCNSRTKAYTGHIYLEVTPQGGDLPTLEITYPTLQAIPLATVPKHYGGVQIYFMCPKCNRRVFKLYCPVNGKIFACSQCYELSYQSRQDTPPPPFIKPLCRLYTLERRMKHARSKRSLERIDRGIEKILRTYKPPTPKVTYKLIVK